MSLQPFDERYNPSTGEWTCPMCLQRRDAVDGCSDELPHLCDTCWGILQHDWPDPGEPSGLRWKTPCGWWELWTADTYYHMVGQIMREIGTSRFVAFRCTSRLAFGTVVHRGTLSECAHALVKAVKEGAR